VGVAEVSVGVASDGGVGQLVAGVQRGLPHGQLVVATCPGWDRRPR
jgi:hypothetical protein